MTNGQEGEPDTPEFLMPDSVREAHAWSRNNRYLVTNSKYCGCFYCLAQFPAHEVRAWGDDGKTAICPNCGLDAVVPDARDRLLPGIHNLRAMRDYWFGKPRREEKQC